MPFRRVAAALLAFASMPILASNISVWVAPWDANALTSLQTNAGAMTESNPVWYSIDERGAIVTNWNAENATWRAAMTATSIVPTLQNVVSGSFRGDLMASLLASATYREQHAEAIRQLAVNDAYDGIDIDYEAMPAGARADFSSFIGLLGSKLHQSGKTLSVTVHAKTSDAQNWSGPGSQDWNFIGGVADSVKIMAYDYHWSTSAAGPLSPLSWLDQVATYAESSLPAAKIMIALPWYGYDWQGSVGQAIGYADGIARAQSANATIAHDANGEATFTYADHTVYFQDAKSYATKRDYLLQRHPSLGGFAHWKGGDEDPATWDVIRSASSGGSGSSTLPAADFLINGSSTMNLLAGASATNQYGLVSINNFNADTSVSVDPVGAFPGTFSLSRSVIRPGVTTSLTVVGDKRAATGTYQLKLTFKSGSLVHEQLVSVGITAVSKRQRQTAAH